MLGAQVRWIGWQWFSPVQLGPPGGDMLPSVSLEGRTSPLQCQPTTAPASSVATQERCGSAVRG